MAVPLVDGDVVSRVKSRLHITYEPLLCALRLWFGPSFVTA